MFYEQLIAKQSLGAVHIHEPRVWVSRSQKTRKLHTNCAPCIIFHLQILNHDLMPRRCLHESWAHLSIWCLFSNCGNISDGPTFCITNNYSRSFTPISNMTVKTATLQQLYFLAFSAWMGILIIGMHNMICWVPILISYYIVITQ